MLLQIMLKIQENLIIISVKPSIEGKILVEIQSEDELKIHEGRETTKKLEVTESPVGLIQTLNAEWPSNKNIVFVKPRNIESSGSDVTNQSPRDIIQRLG